MQTHLLTLYEYHLHIIDFYSYLIFNFLNQSDEMLFY